MTSWQVDIPTNSTLMSGLKGHCGDAIYVDRMTREAECIMHPALSAILSIQPSVLDEIMSNTTMTGRGLIASFLYVSPLSRIGSRVFRTHMQVSSRQLLWKRR